MREEGAIDANRSHLLVLVALLSPFLPFAFLVALQTAASSRIMTLLCSSPRGLHRCHGWPALEEEEEEEGEDDGRKGEGSVGGRGVPARYLRQSKGCLALR